MGGKRKSRQRKDVQEKRKVRKWQIVEKKVDKKFAVLKKICIFAIDKI